MFERLRDLIYVYLCKNITLELLLYGMLVIPLFEVEAFNREEAKELILKECGLVMGGDIHTTLPDGEVRWNFDTHPEKQIGKITIKRR